MRVCLFRHRGLEWPTRFELALRPWRGRVLPLTLRPRGASGEIRTHGLRLTEAALCPLELQRQRSESRSRTCVRRFQGPAGMPATHLGMEPSPGADPGLLPYRGRVTAVCDGGAPAQAMAVVSASRTNGSLRAYAGAGCPRRESDPHCQRPRRCAYYQIGLRGPRAATRCRPGHPPYKGGAAAVRGGLSCPPRIRTTITASRMRWPAG
jgi:hypothetical protein